ncbi:MAG: histidine kinase [Candidatus Sedimenticola endophacoides]|uniref:Oxygen sensor histidine kinase NreB n=2 Tax=Candidatus Sedimenticola endophacoides TaxID=2548426 RepID=A0A657Q6S0_9GAMM|nr:MAG: histidine kinase [Candidatus Sedimenticola endophacoides]OQX34687.1 MAG: histidine kinase [Candidatus Sedimenticola endophacoides]OQX40097.1 MAG: histidine kinase [Candidatus Sedimenticola endophacoides]OQX41816.1 MAG: histidine kinase [Candidatus Sedimenticola endophacoides]OQX43829.1 MAG: histidine kinase [Candidatus Sedimenticola endophacoides]
MSQNLSRGSDTLVVLMATAITTISLEQARSLSEEEIRTFEERLLASKRHELRNYVGLALTSIKHIEQDRGLSEETAKQEIKRILNGLTFGDDGYFFVYDPNGVNLVHPILPELVGRNLHDLQDRNGDYVIRNLLRLAGEGGGFHRYVWNKPSTGQDEDKLSYVVQLKRWPWMMGTGLYIDDIAKEVAKARKQVQRNVRNTFFTVLVVVAGTIVLVVLIGVAINVHEVRKADSRLQELAHKSVQFQVSERRRFARELHDGINQMMVSVLYRIEAAVSKLKQQGSAAEEDLERGHRTLKEAINEVRHISHDLRPSLLDDMGLKVAVNSLLMDFSERTGIDAELEYEITGARLPEDIEITFYRVLQEALANVERHSGADRVLVSGWHRDGVAWIEIRDNGRGFDTRRRLQGPGIGVCNMRERVELLSGICQIDSEPGRGTSVKVGLRPMFFSENCECDNG